MRKLINFASQSCAFETCAQIIWSTKSGRESFYFTRCSIFDGFVITEVNVFRLCSVRERVIICRAALFRVLPEKLLSREASRGIIFSFGAIQQETRRRRERCFVRVSGPIQPRWLLRDNIISRYSRDKCFTNSGRLEARRLWITAWPSRFD